MSEPVFLDVPAAEGDEPVLTIAVYGIPGPQGSKTALGGNRMRESSAKVKPWRECVGWRAIEARNKAARRRGWRMLTGPVELSMVFTLPRPRSHFGTGRNAAVVKGSAPVRPSGVPDVSKLARSTEDALTGLIYRDDALVVGYRRLTKHYDTDHGRVPDVLDAPGCVIRVWPLAPAGVSA
jgi:hypothetical protein